MIRTVWVVVVSVSILLPLNIPLAALAYKIHLGDKPVPMETTPYWIRSTFVAVGLALMCLVLMFADYWLVTTGPPDQRGIDGGLLLRRGPAPAEEQPVNAYVCTVGVASVDEDDHEVSRAAVERDHCRR